MCRRGEPAHPHSAPGWAPGDAALPAALDEQRGAGRPEAVAAATGGCYRCPRGGRRGGGGAREGDDDVEQPTLAEGGGLGLPARNHHGPKQPHVHDRQGTTATTPRTHTCFWSTRLFYPTNHSSVVTISTPMFSPPLPAPLPAPLSPSMGTSLRGRR